MESAQPTTIITFTPLPTTLPLLAAFKASPLSRKSSYAIHELDSDHKTLELALQSDGIVITAGSLASLAHLLAPRQRAFFNATEDSNLFRTLIHPHFPDYFFKMTTTPWVTPLDFTTKKYVVKPNIGYSSVDTFVLDSITDQQTLLSQIQHPDQQFIIEEYIRGVFLCSDIVVENGDIIVTSIYQRYDAGIKETAQYHASALYHQYYDKFLTLAKSVIVQSLPIPQVRTLFNVEAKLGDDGILRIIEINPFRACGVAPLATSLVFGRNVFELAFAEKLSDVEEPEGEKEIVICLARKLGESANDVMEGVLGELEGKDGEKRRAVELERILEEKDKEVFEIHDGRIFELIKE